MLVIRYLSPLVWTIKMNNQQRGDERVLALIRELARGSTPAWCAYAISPNHHRVDDEPNPAGVGLLQVLSIDGFTALQDSITTRPIPMDRDTQIRNYHYDTHTAALELYGALYDARAHASHPGTVSRVSSENMELNLFPSVDEEGSDER